MSLNRVPDANFTPQLVAYNGQGQFRFWCQKVLPIVYDDSLSYYELLNKVVVELNRVIENVTHEEENIQLLLNAYNELQGYVNHYFDNLDVQAEINVKINEMASDGSLLSLIEPVLIEEIDEYLGQNLGNFVDEKLPAVVGAQLPEVVEGQLPDVASSQVPGAVTTWLDDNVNPTGSAVMVDASLSISGAAADAKVAGDRLKEDEKTVESIMISENKTFEQGSLNRTSGGNASSTNTIRTPNAFSCNKIVINGDYKGVLFAYSGSTFVGYWNGSEFITGTSPTWYYFKTFQNMPANYEYKIIVKKDDESDILPSVGSNVFFYIFTDKELNKSNKAADAYVVGQEFASVNANIEENNNELKYVTGITGYRDSVPDTDLVDGKRVNSSNGNITNDDLGLFSATSLIECSKFEKIKVTMPIINRNVYFGFCFYDENETYIIGYRCKYVDGGELGVEEKEFFVPSGCKYFATTWFLSSVAEENDFVFSCEMIKDNKLDQNTYYISDNKLDESSMLNGYYVDITSGAVKAGANYTCTDYIAVNEGDNIVFSNKRIVTENQSQRMSMRFVAAFDEFKSIVSNAGGTYVGTAETPYVVPSGVKYIRITVNTNILTNPLNMVRVNGQIAPYVEHYAGQIIPNYNDIYNYVQLRKYYPFTSLPDGFLNLLSYKPLGSLSKHYICLVSDDGDDLLATYTIPMLIAKQVPCTFAVMQTSRVWANNTAVVVDAVENHGCSIAQHGDMEFTSQDELTLTQFFDREATFFDSIGLAPTSAVCPRHYFNKMVSALCGARYGVLRTGDQEAEISGYGGLCVPRSNVYALPSRNVLANNLNLTKEILDYAYENKLLRVMHWHDDDFATSVSGYRDNRSQLEAVIDYAKSLGFTFITLDQVNSIV